MSRADLIIKIAAQYIGKLEKPGNKGFLDAAFQKLMVMAGWLSGDPWCATFGKMVWLQAYASSPALLALVRKLCTPGAVLTYKNYQKNGTFEVSQIPKRGSLVIWQHGNGPQGHMGILESFDGDNTLTTIEGNTNASGSREGDRVARKLRTLKRPFSPTGLNLVGFVHPKED